MSLSLFSNTYGSAGPPLVILHGFLGESGNWHTLARTAFAPHFRVYALDARNHGRSPHTDDFSYEAMAEDVRAFLDAEGLDDAFLLGHSMGGKTAMQFALTHPERTQALVVADMAPHAYPPGHDDILEALNGLDPGRLASRQEADDALTAGIPDWRVRQFLLKNLVARKEGGYRWAFNLPVLTARSSEVARGLEAAVPYAGPALFVRGGTSRYVRDQDVPGIERLFPAAQIVTLPETGHWMHAEAPEAFAGLVLDFLLPLLPGNSDSA